MVASVGFGTLSFASGSARLSGTASKLDTEALVTAAYEAKRLPAVRLEAKIDRNDAKISALGELSGLLKGLRDAVDGLRNPPGSLGLAQNRFEAKQAFLSAGGTTTPGSLLGVSVENGASVGAFDLVVERVATAHKLQAQTAAGSDQTLADAWNGGVGFTGGLEVGLAGGTKVTITVDGSMTLADLRAAINARATESGVGANLVQVADGDVRLVLAARETGKAIELTDTGPDSVTALLQTSELVAAQTAQIQLDGITVERSTNRIDDVLDGVVLDLYAADPATTVTVAVETDVQGVKEQILGFVDAYNAFRDFQAKHAAVGADGSVAADAVLFADSTLRTIARSLDSEVGGAAFGLDADALATLRDVGITLGDGGRLQVDEGKLDSMLLARLDEVRAIFEFQAVTGTEELAVFGRGNELASSSFVVAITDADNDGVAEAASIDGVAAEVSGGRILGPAGTAYEGLELVWVGQGSTSINVDVSQGIADRLYNLLDDALRFGTGRIARATEELSTANADYRERIDTIEERALKARELLIEKLTGMESALSLANTLLDQVRAQMDAMNGGA